MGHAVTITSLSRHDWPAVARIWSDGIATGEATFEVQPPTWEEFDRTRHRYLRLVARHGGQVVGWAAASPVSTRRVYAGVAEHSVYVARDVQGLGVGRALLDALTRLSEACGIWTLRSAVFPENAASLALHERCGFAVLGRQTAVGRRDGRWRDVLVLERRSTRVGRDDEPLIRLALPSAGGRNPHGDDRDAVEALLAAAHLPPDGLDDVWRLWVADADGMGGAIVGAVALERHPAGTAPGSASYLLRSLAVAPHARGGGLGRRLLYAALTVADSDHGGPAPVGLLTESADGYFAERGFALVERARLPQALQTSPQLQGVCPSSAQAFLRAPSA